MQLTAAADKTAASNKGFTHAIKLWQLALYRVVDLARFHQYLPSVAACFNCIGDKSATS